MEQLFQIVGALAILAAFVGVQVRRLDSTAWGYLLLNLVGSAVLAVVAALDRD